MNFITENEWRGKVLAGGRKGSRDLSQCSGMRAEFVPLSAANFPQLRAMLGAVWRRHCSCKTANFVDGRPAGSWTH